MYVYNISSYVTDPVNGEKTMVSKYVTHDSFFSQEEFNKMVREIRKDIYKRTLEVNAENVVSKLIECGFEKLNIVAYAEFEEDVSPS